MSSANFGLIRRTGEDSRIRLFQNWSRVDIQLFDNSQWYTLAPSFMLGHDGTAQFYKVHGRARRPAEAPTRLRGADGTSAGDKDRRVHRGATYAG
ncbi:hypothetical protein B0T18DRAFT_417191 [Schizothecium vesticola]|uniref:Uncharacterized protein n=1 Tax=Schizothecium vesticola TaxID=314040 RepID=A0AA40EIE0_9PEZI|nr:hypothetical protein B0T18DRAFT_417191 [Schizothecium vesticola]